MRFQFLKNKDQNNVENYCPVSILPYLSKIYERLQHTTLSSCDDRKMAKCLDKESISMAILTDLSRTFDCILHDLLIAKFAAYGFDYQSLRIMESFHSNRQQRTKLNNAFSRYFEIIYGVSQGSILGFLLFNI